MWLILLIITLCVSCSSGNVNLTNTPHSEDNPFIRPTETFPGVIIGFNSTPDGYILTSRRVCIYLEQAPFWEVGDYWDGVTANIPNITILIDNQKITGVAQSASGALTLKRDDKEELVGAHAFSFDLCFSPLLDEGSHMLSVQVITTSGKEYEYSWEFMLPPELNV